MTGQIMQRLREKNIVLPDVAKPVANYVPFVISGNTLVISGQLPMDAGVVVFKGHLGNDVSIDDGIKAARLCAVNIVAQAQAALGGNLDRITRCVRLGGFVSSVPEFTDHPKVVNGASDFMVEVFGDAGKHARAAVGVSALPLGAAVEVDAIFEIRGEK